MKIVAFSQLRNELSKGNLENWFQSMQFCDYIYIYDQNSTDGSKEYYKKFGNCVVVESPINNFCNELSCKQYLLSKLLSEHPDTDWVCWSDGDNLMDGRLYRENNKELFNLLEGHKNVDSIWLGHLNLWRSDVHYRLDDNYNWFNIDGRAVFWRNTGRLYFDIIPGLHNNQHPHGINDGPRFRCKYYLIHRGFATDSQIIERYNLYKGMGQSGYSLERLLNEDGLTVAKLADGILPDWFEIKDDIDPRTKAKIRDIHNKITKL